MSTPNILVIGGPPNEPVSHPGVDLICAPVRVSAPSLSTLQSTGETNGR